MKRYVCDRHSYDDADAGGIMLTHWPSLEQAKAAHRQASMLYLTWTEVPIGRFPRFGDDPCWEAIGSDGFSYFIHEHDEAFMTPR